MARIVIKDLNENITLDQKAMKNIRGGARGRVGGSSRTRAPAELTQPPLRRLFSNK